MPDGVSSQNLCAAPDLFKRGLFSFGVALQSSLSLDGGDGRAQCKIETLGRPLPQALPSQRPPSSMSA